MAPETGALDDEALERYARHIVLREIGGAGQARLRAARVLVVGAGGLGSPALLYLAAAGVGTLGIVDDDRVSLSNLQRQVLFATAQIGERKVDAAAKALAALNPLVQVRAHPMRLDGANAYGIVRDYDLVLDGSDNFATRDAVNRACVAAARPLVSAAIGTWDGQVSVFAPHLGAPCYACLHPVPPADDLAPPCAAAGVVGALPGIIGAMQAAEAIKLLTGAGQPLLGRLWLHDLLESQTRVITVHRQAGCAVCGADPTRAIDAK